MDVQMPNMNGYDSTRHIRALDRPDAATVPIIAMTANAYREDIDRALAAGMNAHLSKPIDIGEVTKQLNKWLSN
jgi:CheY-like chemotaxis protein